MTTLNKIWAKQAMSWEYTSAATPDLHSIPFQAFPASLHEAGETRIIELNISDILETPYPASSPSLLANYIRICQGESISTHRNTTSELFYVMRGSGRTTIENDVIEWQAGDVFTLPYNKGVIHKSNADSALFWTHDAPLLSYLGVTPTSARFKPAFYHHDDLIHDVHALRDVAIQEKRNRAGIILGNHDCEKSKTMTHNMWSLLNVLPKRSFQKPHRHNSVALDLALSCGEHTYTLMGKEVDREGNIIDPIKAVWQPHSVFITPPGWWHSHHNESEQDAYVFPVQDAGLHTYLRTLDIQFIQ